MVGERWLSLSKPPPPNPTNFSKKADERRQLLRVEVYVNETDQIVLARQGDERAWVVLVQQHQAALFHLAYLMLGDADEAADVAQDAFIRAFYALSPRFTSRGCGRFRVGNSCYALADNPGRAAGCHRRLWSCPLYGEGLQ